MIDMPDTSKAQETLHTLPDDVTIVDDAVDGATWILYDDHLIASWDGSTGKSKVRIHLRQVGRGLVGLELDQFSGALQYLQATGFQMSGSHTVPPEDNNGMMEIFIFEARDVPPGDLKEAIFWTLSASNAALDLTK